MHTVRNMLQQVTRDANSSQGALTPLIIVCLPFKPFSFTGSVGDAIISKSAAYLVTDARYWHHAERELDLSLWTIVQASPDGLKDWTEWLLVSRLRGL